MTQRVVALPHFVSCCVALGQSVERLVAVGFFGGPARGKYHPEVCNRNSYSDGFACASSLVHIFLRFASLLQPDDAMRLVGSRVRLLSLGSRVSLTLEPSHNN